MGEVSRDRIDAIMRRLQTRAALSEEELGDLQAHIDQVERAGSSSHHDTTSHHHTTRLLETPGLLERR